jgi:hypothetical protein
MANRNILKQILAFLLIGCLTNVLASGERRNGTAGAQELLVPVGARGMGLVGTDIAGLSGVEAIYYNPAGMSNMTGSVEATFSYMTYIADINLVYGAVAINLGEIGSLGVGVKTLDIGEIPVTTTDRPEGTGAMFSPRFTVIGLSYSNFLTANIKAGVSFNLISEQISSSSANGLSIDAGIQYDNFALVNGLKLGLVLKNFGPQMKFSGPDLIRNATDAGSLRGEQFYLIDAASFELPSQLAIGISYDINKDEQISYMVSSAYESNNFSNDGLKIAGEVGFNDMFFLRGGYIYVAEASSESAENIFGPTFGGGVNLQSGNLELIFDYAYRITDYFDDNQVFALTILF